MQVGSCGGSGLEDGRAAVASSSHPHGHFKHSKHFWLFVTVNGGGALPRRWTRYHDHLSWTLGSTGFCFPVSAKSTKYSVFREPIRAELLGS